MYQISGQSWREDCIAQGMLHNRIPHYQSPHQPLSPLLVQYKYRTLLLLIGAVSQTVLQGENLPHQIQPEFLGSLFPAAAFYCAPVATQQIICTGKILHFLSFPAVLADTTALAGIVTAPICHKVWKDASSFPAHFFSCRWCGSLREAGGCPRWSCDWTHRCSWHCHCCWHCRTDYRKQPQSADTL